MKQRILANIELDIDEKHWDVEQRTDEVTGVIAGLLQEVTFVTSVELFAEPTIKVKGIHPSP